MRRPTLPRYHYIIVIVRIIIIIIILAAEPSFNQFATISLDDGWLSRSLTLPSPGLIVSRALPSSRESERERRHL